MASQGRTRRARPSYANLFTKANSDDESAESSGSDQSRPHDGSIFDPEQATESAKNQSGEELMSDATSDVEMEILLDEKEESEEELATRKNSKGGHQKGNNVAKKTPEGLENAQSLPNGMRPQRPTAKASSSLPAKDHRHRPGSLWFPPSNITRLSAKPGMFSFPDIIPTTSSENLGISHRVKKAWMYCISAGPCWELLEDRAFYKEEYVNYEPTSRRGRLQRPLVYTDMPSTSRHKELPAG